MGGGNWISNVHPRAKKEAFFNPDSTHPLRISVQERALSGHNCALKREKRQFYRVHVLRDTCPDTSKDITMVNEQLTHIRRHNQTHPQIRAHTRKHTHKHIHTHKPRERESLIESCDDVLYGLMCSLYRPISRSNTKPFLWSILPSVFSLLLVFTSPHHHLKAVPSIHEKGENIP